ncbi:2TM domain-containing protein [Candidatus Dojkabacteria bacterium]|nr:2TM domain-containing protein [Candidatus Dojkabacteria bacterium]
MVKRRRLTEEEIKSAEKEAKKKIDARFGLLRHFFIYSIVNTFLLGFDYFVTKEADWAYIPVFIWGIGLFGHALSVTFEDFISGWKAKMIEKEAGRIKSNK